MPPPPTHLSPSSLGQKSHWDAAYTTELSNFSTNAADVGTIWFSDACAEERMLSFLSGLSDSGALDQETTRFLDLGTGNGHMLFALREDGWRGAMVGVDYSGKSVELARGIQRRKGEGYEDLRFEEWDVLAQAASPMLAEGWDVVLDKGTFDAVCLSNEVDARGRRVCEGYKERVVPLIAPGGRFLITSCNWTEEELKGWFDGGELGFVGKVKYPSFTFGGREGSSVVTLCFQRNDTTAAESRT
ncbi:S-adenosyl-L-methionine-dependent methyltransferase [Ampelomyces quisqualis]|uniref:Protein-lysine N-methyltransferase EFM4 n=1 Tax=Ampelomyces quisqualis TaxID=50730 RepID=A0A6A5QWA2_AMPQU|nr:S-adenosyl-L-methionine-dependent methyltransferase [Ampelomyces quisqualis]